MRATATRMAQKTIGLEKQTKTLASAQYHAYLYIFWASLHEWKMKIPNLTFCGGRETRQGLHVSFPELRCSPLESNFKNNSSTFDQLWTRWNKSDKFHIAKEDKIRGVILTIEPLYEVKKDRLIERIQEDIKFRTKQFLRGQCTLVL